MSSALSQVIGFFDRIGVFDVVLPFLLVFTIVFAILERSAVLGKEKDGSSKKNLNAMAAFVMGFLVVASSRLVGILTRVSSQVVVLIMLSVLFMLLVGTISKDGEPGKEGLPPGWKAGFVWINFIVLIFIFLANITTSSGTSWLDEVINWINQFWTSAIVGSVILIIGIIIFMKYIMGDDTKPAAGAGGGGG